MNDNGGAAPTVRALRVGLTGGIASGKSLVANMFMKLGAELVDADQLAREVVAPGEPALSAIRDAFGPQLLTPRGELDRAALRKLVFADAAKRGALDALLHPLIRARLLARLDEVAGRTRSSRCRCSSRPTSRRSSTGSRWSTVPSPCSSSA